jgi:flagellar motor switch protein FliM
MHHRLFAPPVSGRAPAPPETPALTREQVRRLQRLHAALAPVLQTALRALIPDAGVTLLSLTDTVAGAYAPVAGRFDCQAGFRAALPDAGLLECCDALAWALVSRQLGSTDDPTPTTRGLSEIERQLWLAAVEPLLAAYANGWPVELRVRAALEADPTLLPADEPVFAAVYAVTASGLDGRLAVLLRLPAWRAALAPLDAPPPAEPVRHELLDAISDVQVPALVLLGSTTVTIRDMLALQPGDIICLDQPADAPLEVRINAQPRLTGRASLEHNRYVITVDTILPGGPRHEP